ncbi:MAG: type II toxin-antitoxin system PemK/MazF family toxin, partial [Thermomicrobiales bacterium]
VRPEQIGSRPSLVISGDWFNDLENYLVFAVPITGTDRGLIYQVKVSGNEGGLSKNYVIMCEQARAVSVMRCIRKRGEVSDQTLATVQRMVTAILNKTPF